MSLTIEKKGAKYSIPVYTKSYATKISGYIECDSLEDYNLLVDENYDGLLEEGYFSVNISNDFELSDVDLEVSNYSESDLDFFLKER